MGDLELTVLFAVGRHVNRRLKRPPPSFLFAPATVETKATRAPLALVNLLGSGATIFWKCELLRRLCHLQPLKCVRVIDMTNDFPPCESNNLPAASNYNRGNGFCDCFRISSKRGSLRSSSKTGLYFSGP